MGGREWGRHVFVSNTNASFCYVFTDSASCTATDLGGNDSCKATDFGVSDCCKTTDLAEVDNCEDSSHTAVPTGLNYGGSNATSSSNSCREAPTKRQSDGM